MQPPASDLRVSVIIPAYASESTIERALESVLEQTYPAFEIIVIDDGSPIPLSDRLAGYESQIRLWRTANRGAAAARNAGIDQAGGDLIAFLDADDSWHPEKLAESVSVLRDHPDVQLVASRYLLLSGSGTAVNSSVPLQRDCGRKLTARKKQLLRVARQISTPTVIVRRDHLAHDRFDTTLKTAEDRDLWVRLISRGTCYFLNRPLVRVEVREVSLSHANLALDCNCMLRVIDRYRREIGWLQARQERAIVHYKWSVGAGCLRHWWNSLRCWPLPLTTERTGHVAARLRLVLRLFREQVLARPLRMR